MVRCVSSVVDRQGCDPATRFLVPSRNVHWVALLQRGNCTFKEKILKAAAYNATAVLIYNNSTNKTVKMGHEGQSPQVLLNTTPTLISYTLVNVGFIVLLLCDLLFRTPF